MGFKQRERKRRRKAAMTAAQERARTSGPSAGWWLTVVQSTTCCARCGGVLRTGAAMVYRASPREASCMSCAESRGLSWRPSVRWERSRSSAG